MSSGQVTCRLGQSLFAPGLLLLILFLQCHVFQTKVSRCFLFICLEQKANVHSAFCSEVVPTNRRSRNPSLQCLEPFYSECGPQSPWELFRNAGLLQTSRIRIHTLRCSAYHGRPTTLGFRVTSSVLQGHKSTRGPNTLLLKLLTLPS